MSKHPDDACRCGTTRNGAKSDIPGAWSWRGATYQTHSEQRRDEMRDLQDAIEYWNDHNPARGSYVSKSMDLLFDRAMADPQLAAAILAHRDGKDVEYQVGTADHWACRKTEPGLFYPSFDSAVKWRPAQPPKPKRPHADLIEKRLEEKRWIYRNGPTGPWMPIATPTFNHKHEYLQEPVFSEGRKAMVRDWLSGTEYEVRRFEQWKPADVWDLLEYDIHKLRKKPTTVKLRSRVAVVKSKGVGIPPRTWTVSSDEAAKDMEKDSGFIRWMGPWQETEVDAE